MYDALIINIHQAYDLVVSDERGERGAGLHFFYINNSISLKKHRGVQPQYTENIQEKLPIKEKKNNNPKNQKN